MKVRLVLIFGLAMGLALLLTGGPGRALTAAARSQVALAVAPTPASGPTVHLAPSAPCEVGGLITTDTTWGPGTCDPYIATVSVSVQSGATLTITPGTTVKFDSLKFLAVAGTLVARGAATKPITFTSNLSSAAPGNWGYIYFSGSSVDATFDGGGNYIGGSIIQNAVIEYAGGASVSNNGALRIEASAPFIDHNTIKYNQGNGISIWSHGTPHIKGNTITHNSENGIYVYDSSPTIEQRNTITGHSHSGIYVNSFFSGNPIIQGNTITGNSASQGGGICISYGAAIISNNVITGNSASQGGGIYLSGTNPTIRGNTIANNTAAQTNGGGGIYLTGSYPTINDNDLYGNTTGNPPSIPNDLYNGNTYGGAAVNAMNNDWGTTDPQVIEDHIWHFLDDPWRGFVSYNPFPSVPCMVLGIIDTNTTWSPSKCDPYVVSGHLSVQPGATLTIEDGTTVRFDSLKVLAVAGTLVAQGAATKPITFTSNQSSPAAGDWGYIYFSGSSIDATFDGNGNYTGGSIIQHAVIEYAGGRDVTNDGALYIEASAPFIGHNTIRNNQDNGIDVWSRGTPRIRGNAIARNSGAGIYVHDSSPTIQGNSITDHSRSGIYVYSFFSGSPTIQGNTITGNSASQGGGIYIVYGTAVISCNTIVSNTATGKDAGGGIYVAGNSFRIEDNNLYGNMTGNPPNVPNDLYNGNGYVSTAVTATHNYWGTTDRLVIEGHIFHCLDDPSRGCVNYEDWRTSPVPPCTIAPAIEVTIRGPTTGTAGTPYTFTAAVSPLTATQPITYVWQASGQSSLTHVGGLSDTAVFTWTATGSQVVTVTATSAQGTVTDTHAITVSTSQCVPVGRVTISGPTTGTAGTPHTFIAAVSPTTATQPITYTWQATGQSPRAGVGGVNSTAIFTWCMPGPQVITATVSNACGSAKANHSIAIAEPDVGRDAYEPDDTCAQAGSLESDGTVQWHTFHRYADEDWVRFTAMSGTTYVIQTANTGPLVETALELRTSCTASPIPISDLDLGPGTRISWTASQTATHYLRVTNHAPCDYGPQAGYDLSVRAASEIGAAIVVAGRNQGGALHSNINFAANRAVLVFLGTGLSRGNLYYLNSDPHPGSGLTPDAPATSDNLQHAIETWAADKVGPDRPFYLYLVDHGGSDVFLTNGIISPTTAADLDGWLHHLETATGCPVNVIVEACRSGSFIDWASVPTQTVSGAGRVVIASTSATRNAYALPNRGAYFSDSFFTALAGGADLWTAFREGQQAVAAHGLWQMPWLDDNGNAIPHVYDPDDGREARRRGLLGMEEGGIAPYIETVSGPVEIVDGRGEVRAQVVDDMGVDFVWALVYRPSFREPATTDEETIELRLGSFVLLDGDGDGEYVGSYDGFTELGEYRIVVYAKDGDDNLALPQVVMVRTRWGMYLPLVTKQ